MIRNKYKQVQLSFHNILGDMQRRDFQARSLNPGWTNLEILVHMTFGFVILIALLPLARAWGRLPRSSSKWFAGLLNALTRPFNWINKGGAHFQAKVVSPDRLGRLFDRSISTLMKKSALIHKEEWTRGMYYPNRWDPNFKPFMSIADLFHYPVEHFILTYQTVKTLARLTHRLVRNLALIAAK